MHDALTARPCVFNALSEGRFQSPPAFIAAWLGRWPLPIRHDNSSESAVWFRRSRQSAHSQRFLKVAQDLTPCQHCIELAQNLCAAATFQV